MFLRRTHVEKYTEREVIYSEDHWSLLQEKRAIAEEIMRYLLRNNITPYLFGSVARGDIHRDSDIEIIIFEHSLLTYVDIILAQKYDIIEREIIQATPRAAIKVIFRLSDLVEIVVPAVPLTKIEHEFYRYGGLIEPPQAYNYRKRVPGVNKRLCMIIPTERGHMEWSIIGRESEVIRILGVSPELIEERKRVLMQRDARGRTGVYLSVKVDPDEDIYSILRRIRDRDPAIKRLFKLRGVSI